MAVGDESAYFLLAGRSQKLAGGGGRGLAMPSSFSKFIHQLGGRTPQSPGEE